MINVKIKDLYAGKPDAKDEINFDGYDKFIKTFVKADHFNFDLLLNGNHCFITGLKGTGKTALLYYLDDLIKQRDHDACSSFIFFKEDFSSVKRDDLLNISKRVQSSVTVESNALINVNEFEYIWRWIIFKQIVADNETYAHTLFINDDYWKKFENLVSHIIDPKEKRKIFLPNKLRFSIPYIDHNTSIETGFGIEVDLQNKSSVEYNKFINLIDRAEQAFSNVKRTIYPYHIFIDELEAYYGEKNIFFRDLNLIRDLIFTVKNFNTLFSKLNMHNTKIFCSVRSEILNAISRFTTTKEINKIISGFSIPLIWNYSNNNSYKHPIIQILLKRIALCLNYNEDGYLQLYKDWFPEKIHDLEPAAYILNNSWCKPRDIVRLISSAQNSLHNDSDCFSQSVFSSITKTYSNDSLQEIKEELKALYTSEEVDIIIMCFTGYKTCFSINDLKKRIDLYFKDSILSTKFSQILGDLYRLGFLGNFLPSSKVFRWNHRGDSNLIVSNDWRLYIHFALHSALSLNSKSDFGQNKQLPPQTGDIVIAEVYRISDSFAFLKFIFHSKIYHGTLHISEFRKLKSHYIDNLSDVVQIGNKFETIIERFDDNYNNWKLKINITHE